MKKASFTLEKYLFDKVVIESGLAPEDSTLIAVDFSPKGIYYPNESKYDLIFDFVAYDEKKGKGSPFVMISCIATFDFNDVSSIDDIPPYFYKNSIAIVFPFLRAFVSSVTLQANTKLVMLPTMNLSSLEQPLKDNTTIKQ